MFCKNCASAFLRDFHVELTVAFPYRERLNLTPVCICQKTFVCVECGYTELVFPTADLQKLRKGIETLNSMDKTVN
jgi:hypothetical protein